MVGGRQALVLDAMGVIYRHGDDVAELLIPYLRSIGCEIPSGTIENLYRLASLGRMSSRDFWDRCGVDGDDEAYCQRHELMPGILEALDAARQSGLRVACFSNDVSEWSRVLRERFELHERIDIWVISGDIGFRKPDPAAYRKLIEAVDLEPRHIRYIDDRPANVQVGLDVGLSARLFTSPAAIIE
jgi:putative hydrolase of the HAD superfamily